jgi:hypothetical protein
VIAADTNEGDDFIYEIGDIRKMERPLSLELGTPSLGNRRDWTISARIQRETPGL